MSPVRFRAARAAAAALVLNSLACMSLALAQDDALVVSATRFPEWRCEAIMDLCLHQDRLESKPVHEFMDLFVIN